jgi:tRNA(adenine34) deaminase
MTSPPGAAAGVWQALDEPWREAFRQAWDAFRTGNVPVGAVASTADGEIVHAARNRLTDTDGPPGEVFGSSLAHAETNVLARLPFRRYGDLVLTTTLEPCLQCAAAIRLGPVKTVRFAGRDLYWDGCYDFARLSPREARRIQPARLGPRRDELGSFATLISWFGPKFTPAFEKTMRDLGEGPMLALVHQLQEDGEQERLAAMEVDAAFSSLWPRLRELPVA